MHNPALTLQHDVSEMRQMLLHPNLTDISMLCRFDDAAVPQENQLGTRAMPCESLYHCLCITKLILRNYIALKQYIDQYIALLYNKGEMTVCALYAQFSEDQNTIFKP